MPQISRRTSGGSIILIALIITSLLLALACQYFNTQEINALVSGAEANDLAYELTIYNEFLYTYSFRIIEEK
ncbi:hypothetical protein ACFSY7_03685 [Kurthia populi]|uniref:Uncharacterized protein n=1 Tax=Kurthia populi TaxID=1562132 RepID=A0ABW5XXD7_9BACL